VIHNDICNAATTTFFTNNFFETSFENRIQLSAPRTSALSDGRFSHEGFILKLCMDDNIAGFGEVCLNTFVISIVSLACPTKAS